MVTVYDEHGAVVQTTPTLSGYYIFSDYLVVVVQGGTATGIKVFSDGVLSAGEGGMVQEITVYGGGSVSLQGGTGKNITIYEEGVVSLQEGGTAEDITMEGGGLTVGDGSVASNVYLELHGASVSVEAGGRVSALTLDGATLSVHSGGVLSGSNIRSYTWTPAQGGPSQYYQGTVHLESGALHTGTLSISSTSLFVAEAGSVIDFTLTEADAGSATPLLNDHSRISGSPDYTMTVSNGQSAGTYALAGGAAAFDAPLSLHCGDFAAMQLAVGGDSVVYHNSVYALSMQNDALSVAVSDFEQSGNAGGLAWGEINGASGYALELTKGEETLSLELSTRGADLLGLGNGDYTWRVRNTAEEDNWQTGEAFSQAGAASSPQAYAGETNGAADLFFVRTDGVWDDGYQARHVGDGVAEGTNEIVNLAGRARVTDIFSGSGDASVLVCSVPEAQASGVALFLDDIHSAAEGTARQARLSRIDTIFATGGDDLIDLTSQRFSFAGGVTVRGGLGDDVIWANSGENTLFGDAGDDRIAGGSGSDIIIGGSGNDTIQCLGGEDVLCFGADFGCDLVFQQAGGKVTLWFAEGDESKWDAGTLCYDDGVNSVQVLGGIAAGDIALKFGDDGSDVYSRLLAQGAFDA